MNISQTLSEPKLRKLWKIALWLSFITVGYNLLEGVLATAFGFEDETLALLGFGLDSFIEVLSGIGIVHLLWRLQRSEQSEHDAFERTALRITGSAFFILVVALLLTAGLNVYSAHKPEDTFWGMLIALVSILSMYLLMTLKLNVGKALNSDPIIADAHCTRCCFYMSFILLGSSVLYSMTGFAHLDTLGAIGIAWLAYKEGKECFSKAKSRNVTCCSKNKACA